ncbi:MAG: tRNA (adenosine(37)-N6)-dimethylallyltransferase MiaA [Breznakia sp.]
MKKVLVIVGPTAVGKSEFAMALAKRYNGEIISGDAYQCYKELNIGSAKVSLQQQQEVVHHLIDEVGYKEVYNVKIFQEKARAKIDDILNRNKLPIVCGGTGFYIKSLLYDYVFQEEKTDVDYQETLMQQDNENLFHALIKIDKKASEKLHPNNRKRVIRALMMAHLGDKKSDIIEKQEHALLFDAKIIGLTKQREHLYEAINQRVETLIEQGLKKEVMGLVESEADFQLQSMQGIGYKEWLMYYQKQASIEDVVKKIQKNTRNFAKRQYTWFRNQMSVEWYDVEAQNFPEVILDNVEEWM